MINENNPIPAPVEPVVGQLFSGNRYCIYSYLEHDTPSGEPMDGWDAARESDGDWVKYDDVVTIVSALLHNPQPSPAAKPSGACGCSTAALEVKP